VARQAAPAQQARLAVLARQARQVVLSLARQARKASEETQGFKVKLVPWVCAAEPARKAIPVFRV